MILTKLPEATIRAHVEPDYMEGTRGPDDLVHVSGEKTDRSVLLMGIMWVPGGGWEACPAGESWHRPSAL